jgi:hypothetical protein
MRSTTPKSALALACVTLLAGAVAVQAGDPPAVAKGKKLIDANAEMICKFAHAPATYTYKSHEYVGSKTTKDGLHELTYKFNVKGRLKMQKMQMAFFFKDNGEFEFLRVGDSSTLYEPFAKLSDAYLKQVRGDVGKLPAFAGNAERLRTIDTTPARELCEMYLKAQQKK